MNSVMLPVSMATQATLAPSPSPTLTLTLTLTLACRPAELNPQP